MANLEEPEDLQIRVPRETFYLSLIRRVVTDLARRAGFPDPEVDKIELAVDEACSNVIRYQPREARAGESRPEFEMRARVDSTSISITLSDEGKSFPFDALGNFDLQEHLAELRTGGLGVYIIKSFMDEVEYRHRPATGNELRMVKYLEPACVGQGDARER